MKNKKAMGMGMIISLAMMAFIIVVWAFIFPKLSGQVSAETVDRVTDTGNYDGDDLINILDKCKCQYGEDDNDGCPVGTEFDEDHDPYEKCPPEMLPFFKRE